MQSANPLRTYYCHQESEVNFLQIKERGPAKKTKQQQQKTPQNSITLVYVWGRWQYI